MKWIWICAGAAAGLFLCFLAVCIISSIENRKLRTTRYTVGSPKLPKAFDGCRLVVLADLHNAVFGEGNARLLQAIRAEQPDYILVAGDMLVGKRDAPTAIPEMLLRKLGRDYPVYYGRGNHELRAAVYPELYGALWERYQRELGDSVVWLINEKVKLERNGAALTLYGLDLPPEYYRRFRRMPLSEETLTELLGAPEPDAYRILIAHNPDYFPEYARWGADLTVAGHLHGGMVRLPGIGGLVSPRFHLFPKYDRGRYQSGDGCMLLSGGLGNHTFKFRVNNLPEILSVTLRRE